MIERVPEKRPQRVSTDCRKMEIPTGLRMESELILHLSRPSQRHTNGAREARKAQQY